MVEYAGLTVGVALPDSGRPVPSEKEREKTSGDLLTSPGQPALVADPFGCKAQRHSPALCLHKKQRKHHQSISVRRRRWADRWSRKSLKIGEVGQLALRATKECGFAEPAGNTAFFRVSRTQQAGSDSIWIDGYSVVHVFSSTRSGRFEGWV